MLKIGKKVVSVILVLCLMCSVLSVSAFAASDNVDGSQGVQTGIGDDMNVKSTNSFGSLLTSELEQEADKQEENNGINIFSVEVTGKTASAEFETLQDSTLVVAIYDESGVEMLASGRTAVTKEDTTAEVTIDIETIPKYFYLKAFLVDEEVYRPLCTAYESPNYTKEMQEFFAKTTDDFESDKVLNLDNDDSNNFAVYDDETKIIESNGNKNQVASVDDESKKYVIKNADTSITSLKDGDIFSYNYGDNEILIVKVKSIGISGTTATIYGDEVAMDEVFDYVKIDETSDLSTADYDPSTCGDGVTYNGTSEEEINPKSSSPVGAEFEGSTGATLKFELDKKIGNSTLKGSLDLGVKASVKVYLTISYQYLELKLDYSAKLSISLSLKVSDTLPLGYICISPFAGVMIEFTPSIIVECDGKIEVSGTLKGTLGLKATNTDGIQNISTNPEFKPEIKVEVTIFVGISLEPKVKILSDVITGSMKAMLGAELKATMKKTVEDTSKQIHECNACIAGTISAKASLSFEIKFIKSDKLKFNFDVADLTIKICDFYFSYDFADFGFTTCPHQKYKVTVTVKNSKGETVSGASVNDEYTTNSDGKAEFFLNGGDYTINVKHGELSGKKDISIDGKPISVTMTVAKDLTDKDLISGGGNIDTGGDNNSDNDNNTGVTNVLSLGGCHSAYITKSGDLYMWGHNRQGQLGDGTTTDRYTPIKIMSNVKSVSLGGYHSAAITENGDLYMWGHNECGQIGDETTTDRYTPTKIMSNVKSVSLGYCHSGAITESGDLYMWGNNRQGQLGDGTTTNILTPKKIMSNIKSVSFGYDKAGGISTIYDFIGVITENGDLFMWGYNWQGQLGDGTTANRLIPTKIMSNVKSVSLGDKHSGAITENGDLYMWGYNGRGQLGNGTTNIRVYTPAKIMSNVKSVSLGESHSGAITENGDLYMWGYNWQGQLGDGTATNRNTPIKIMSNVKSVSLGYNHSGVVTENGDLYMWGWNSAGELGDGTTTDSSTPTKITIPCVNSKFSEPVSAGSDYKTETFTDLLPNEVYNFYSMKTQNAENPFGSVNLFYITQATTDENGRLSVTYMPDESYDKAINFVVPLKQTDLSTAVVSMKGLIYNGKEQYVTPFVTLNGKTLVEGKDYDLSGDYFAKDAGIYTVTINGRGLYTGKVDFNYSVVSSGKLGDVDNNGTVTIDDVTLIQKYLASMVELDSKQLKVADVTGDGDVSIDDVTKIQKFIAGLVSSLSNV